MTNRYAGRTDVPVERSIEQVRALLRRRGAERLAIAESADEAFIGFELHDRVVRLRVPLPDRDADEMRYAAGKRRLSDAQARGRYEQACRQRWRAALLVLKASFESIDLGIVTFEQMFLAHMLLPGGQTIGEWIAPQLDALADGDMLPQLLPGLTERPIALGSGRR